MKKYLIKTLIFTGCLSVYQFASAGVGVKVQVTNMTGEVLSSIGTCINGASNTPCAYDSFTINPEETVEIESGFELERGKAGTITTFSIADDSASNPKKKNNYFCKATIVTTTDNSFYPRLTSIDFSIQPIQGEGIQYTCTGTDIPRYHNWNGDTEVIQVTVAKKLTPLTPPSRLPLKPGLAPLKPPSILPLTPGNHVNYVKSDNIRTEDIPDSYYYDVSCLNGTASTFVAKVFPSRWSNGAQQYDLTWPESRDFRSYVHDKIGEKYCQLPPPIKELDTVKSDSIRNDNYYDVNCRNGTASTFVANAVHRVWSNGVQQYELTWNEATDKDPSHRLNNVHGRVGKKYCLLPPAMENAYVVKSDKVKSEMGQVFYDVTCANSSTSSFYIYPHHTWKEAKGGEVIWTNGVQLYSALNDLSDAREQIAVPYCRLPSQKPNVQLKATGQVQRIVAQPGKDAAGNTLSYAITCKKSSSVPPAIFWRKDASYTSWTNDHNTYDLKRPDAALFTSKDSSENKRLSVIIENVAEPYCNDR